jgi:hypothetical protein
MAESEAVITVEKLLMIMNDKITQNMFSSQETIE